MSPINNGTISGEKKSLLMSSGGNILIGVVGLAFASFCSSDAILLDGMFNIVYFATGLFTLKVSSLIYQADDDSFPYGYAFFEPLVNLLKGVLVLGISIMALYDAILALPQGGRSIEAGWATMYAIIATVACVVLAFLIHRSATMTKSPLLKADAKNWLVNAAISSAVLATFISVVVIKRTSLAFLAPYADPSIVIVVVLFTISVPVRIAWKALLELLNRAPDASVTNHIRHIMGKSFENLPLVGLFVRVVQPGRTRLVMVHVVLPIDFNVGSLETLDSLRTKALNDLQNDYPETTAEFVFTANEHWAEPTSIPAT